MQVIYFLWTAKLKCRKIRNFVGTAKLKCNKVFYQSKKTILYFLGQEWSDVRDPFHSTACSCIIMRAAIAFVIAATGGTQQSRGGFHSWMWVRRITKITTNSENLKKFSSSFSLFLLKIIAIFQRLNVFYLLCNYCIFISSLY